jgi:four helix bundle protein
MDEKFNFEKLKVYERSLKLAIEMIKIAHGFNFKYNRIRDQLIGAVISIPLNLAEGSGRRSSKEKVNFYKYSNGSCFELIPLLSICFELKLISKNQYDSWRDEIREFCSMIAGLIRYTNSKL